jgi:hypothetical protein
MMQIPYETEPAILRSAVTTKPMALTFLPKEK